MMDMTFPTDLSATRGDPVSHAGVSSSIFRKQDEHRLEKDAIVMDAYDQLFACSRLRSYAGGLVIRLDDEVLILTGTLPSFFLKQVLQENLRSLGKQIENRVKVLPR